MKKYISIFMAVAICLLCCSCNSHVDTPNDNITESTTEDTTKFIESLHFEVNETVANSKPEDLYIQIGDIYFSPTEALKTSEFIERADKSIMKLTYKICEDDIKNIFADYTPEYLVPGGEDADIFFYCDGQLVFAINIINFSDEATAIKDCYVFVMNEMYEVYSKKAVNTKGMSWYSPGVAFDGGEYTLTSIKELFNQWGLDYEENSKTDSLNISARTNKIEIKFEHQNGSISSYPYYIAEINQSTGKVVSFSYSITGYNKGTYTPTEATTGLISSSSESTTAKKTTTNKNAASTQKENTTKKPSASVEPDFEYISKVTTYDGLTYYKVYDEIEKEYYYKDKYGFGYSETFVLDKIRPSHAEIKANPISKVTLNGVTWYKYETGCGTRYLASDGRDMTGIDIGIPTNGKNSITVSGVTFYKTYVEGVGYEYYDTNGNYLLYDASYCYQCGKADCTPAMSTYYCVICKENVSAHKCHPSDHFDASH